MTARSGTALLPLHYGRVPPWLASRMASLRRVIAEAIVHHLVALKRDLLDAVFQADLAAFAAQAPQLAEHYRTP
jgi:hypothetical protein